MNEATVYVVLFFLFGIGAFFWGFMRLRRKRLIENIPTSTIRGLALGLVELTGKAKRDKPLKSPLTGTDCVLYRYTIERYEKRGRSSSWVTIAKGDTYYCPFWIDDGTGKIFVFPQGAEMILPVDYEFTTGWGRTLPLNLSGFMDRHGIRYRNLFGVATLRFKEWCICPDETVYVLGVAKKSQKNLDDYKDKLFKRIKELKDNPDKMKAVDLNKDGQISPEEWDSAVSKIEQGLLEEEINSCQRNDLADVIIGKGDVEKIFIISDYSQKDLVNTLFWQSLLGVFGGGVVSLVALWLLILRFQLFELLK
ncbi:MAG: hypothetical protein JW734_09235 [Candidatus Omnitrophica bacterium]|nr:hypothetical protein [Candidatus Omnitrophota bacterium]